MWKAIVYKEWIKTRRYLFAALLLTAGFAGYGLLRLYRAVELMGAGHIWEVMVTRNAVFIDPMEFVPLLAGLLLAVVQFVPEMQRKCLKLTLHLPVPAIATLGVMLAFGIAALAVLFGIGVAIVGLGPLPVIARELAGNILCTAMPWFLAGMAAYLLGAWVILEPTWRLRAVNILMSLLVLRLFFLGEVPHAYDGFLPLLALLTACTASLSWISVVRFMAGRQD
ncbi:hypothetical protein [uncultured Alistipes sp.]|uniref:hypothetical protein n=1 Tax=uncultured Alistipes sp. TaxID=538949 RepID=UPI002631D3F2|nr:hypothetical protein [uncultured Alistipes sp.]